MGWQVVLALVLGIPAVLLPVAFVWYLNISGLYQVVRDARQRQKRRIARESGAVAEKHTALT